MKKPKQHVNQAITEKIMPTSHLLVRYLDLENVEVASINGYNGQFRSI